MHSMLQHLKPDGSFGCLPLDDPPARSQVPLLKTLLAFKVFEADTHGCCGVDSMPEHDFAV